MPLSRSLAIISLLMVMSWSQFAPRTENSTGKPRWR